MIEDLDLYSIDIPFRESFRHSSADRARTQSVWAEARAGGVTGVGEGCPREYVTAESLSSAREFFARHREGLRRQIQSVEHLVAWVGENEADIDQSPAAWCAIELAILEQFALREGVPVEILLSAAPPSGQFRYSAVIGDSEPEVFRKTAARYREAGFRDFKLKLSGDAGRDGDKMTALCDLNIDGLRIRVDANNLWDDPDTASKHIADLGAPLTGIEEPLAAGGFDAMRLVSEQTGTPIILDESLLRADQLTSLAQHPQHWIVNVRVSKMGGLLRSLHVVQKAREEGVPVIIGAQVGETSVLTRAGLTVAQAAGQSLLAQEGAFGVLLLASDVAEPPLMFGPEGILDADVLALSKKPGWGLTITSERGFLRSFPASS